MAEESVVDEMADIGTGLNDALGCSVAAFFYIGTFFTLLASVSIFII